VTRAPASPAHEAIERAGATWSRVLVFAALFACHATPRGTARVAPGDAIVLVTANVADAQLYVDGKLVGPVASLRGGVAIDPGKHRVEVRADDHFSRYLELDLKKSEKKTIALELEPVLP
jgi:hypothetical protein